MTTLSDTTRGQKAVALVASGALDHALYLEGSSSQRLVPSCSREGAFYVTSLDSCTCPDSTYRKAKVCKHRIALRLKSVLDQADVENTQRLEVVA